MSRFFDTWGSSGEGDAGGESMGGMSMMVEGHEDAGGTGGEEGVCLVKKETKAMAMQEIRKKTATPDAGHKYDDSAGGGGGGAAVRQETTTLSVCRSSSHARAHVFVCANVQLLRSTMLKNVLNVWPLFVRASIAKTFSLPPKEVASVYTHLFYV